MTKKKYPIGFAPVNFRLVGKVFLGFGTILTVLGGLSYVVDIRILLDDTLLFGLVLVVVSLYLLFIVPKED